MSRLDAVVSVSRVGIHGIPAIVPLYSLAFMNGQFALGYFFFAIISATVFDYFAKSSFLPTSTMIWFLATAAATATEYGSQTPDYGLAGYAFLGAIAFLAAFWLTQEH